MSNLSSRNIANTLAKLVSGIFHPLLMPLYGLIILLSAPTFLVYLPSEAKKVLFLVVLINNVFVPLAVLPFLRYRNVISSYKIEDRNERIIPLLTTSVLYCTTSFIIIRFQIPFLLKSFISGGRYQFIRLVQAPLLLQFLLFRSNSIHLLHIIWFW
jgi:hypothetical protein